MFKYYKDYIEALLQYNHPRHAEAMEQRKINMSKLNKLQSPMTDKTERSLWSCDMSRQLSSNPFD